MEIFVSCVIAFLAGVMRKTSAWSRKFPILRRKTRLYDLRLRKARWKCLSLTMIEQAHTSHERMTLIAFRWTRTMGIFWLQRPPLFAEWKLIQKTLPLSISGCLRGHSSSEPKSTPEIERISPICHAFEMFRINFWDVPIQHSPLPIGTSGELSVTWYPFLRFPP